MSLVLVAATLFFGAEVKGARRWIVMLGVNIQPSEFLKPAFVILIAWLFGESARRPEMPANTVALALLLLVVALLVLQPDFGQTMLIALVWGALFFMAGMRLIWVGGLGGVAAVGLAGAYFTVPHVARRIKRFLDPASGDTFKIDIALESFARGGWFGRGPGEGTVKRILPESHTDFVFAVAAEEFGIVLCLVLLALFAFIVIRALRHALRNEDPFARFAAAGLAILFGLQSAINMAVNLHLMPAKGMTLPFISYGGSSMISLAYGMGMLLALTRERPRAEMLASPGEPRSGREPGLMAQRRRAARAGRRRRHRRPSVSRRGAGGGAGAARRRGRSRDRRARRRATARHFPRAQIHVIPSATVRGRDPISLARTAAMLGARRRARPGGCSGGSGPRRWSASAAIRPCRRCWRRRCAAFRRMIHEQNAVMGRANRLLAPRVRAIATGFPGVLDREPALAAKATHTGNPVRPAVIAAAATPYPPLDADRAAAVCSCSAAARARASWPTSCRPRSSGSSRVCGCGSTIVQQAREEDFARVRDDLRAGCRSRPRSRRSSPICRRASRRAIWWCRARAPRPWPSLPRSAGPPSWCRCRMRSTRTSAPMPACWRRRAARSASSRPTSRPSGWPPRFARSPPSPAGSPQWRRPPSPPGRSTPPTGWPIW